MHGHYNGFEPYANIMCIFGGLDPLCETTRVPLDEPDSSGNQTIRQQPEKQLG